MLSLVDISKSYNNITALESISIEIQENKTTVLIGPSGCGKSTLLRIMNGLVSPDTGTVHIDNNLLTSESAPEIRKKMGYVIQDGGLFPNLTAERNISIMAHFLRWPENEINNRLEELLNLTQFPKSAIHRYPVELSGGQQQRVSLMRALMLDPDLLLMDEPLGALDPITRIELQNDLRQIFKTLGKTVVMVTHDIGEAGFFGDVILLMREGKTIQQGTLTDLVQKPIEEFVTRFINAQRNPMDTIMGSST